jgi:hypothetical protein
MESVYVDTSTLAKWYLNERMSPEVERYIRQNAPVHISGLTRVEMRSLLARRRREKQLDPLLEQRVYAVFLSDIESGVIVERSVDDDVVRAAANLISALPSIPLRTLDALHLSVVMSWNLGRIATSDRVMSAAARALGIEVVEFIPS